MRFGRLDELLGYISTYKIFDLFPLDWFLHIIFGWIIYIVFQSWIKRPWLSFFIVAVIALIKEAYDLQIKTFSASESLLDIIATLLIPLILVCIFLLKKSK